MAHQFNLELSMREPPAEAQARAASALTDPARAVGFRLTKRGAGELVLELLESRQVGTQRHHPEVGLVAEHREHQGLMRPVGGERGQRVEHTLGRTGLGLEAALDPVEEVQKMPAKELVDSRYNKFRKMTQFYTEG